MATAAVTGRKAYIYWSTASSKATSAQTKIAELTDYTLTVDRPVIDVTNHDSSGFAESLSDVAKITWDAKMNYLSTGVQGSARAFVLGVNPGLGAISFLLTTSITAHKYAGKTRITGFTQTNPTKGEVGGTIKGEISGPLTRTS